MKGTTGKKNPKNPSDISSQFTMSLPPRRGGFVIIGHRGCNGATSCESGANSKVQNVHPDKLPENTLVSLIKNIKKRHGNEFDVYNNINGIPVLCHDDALNLNVAGADRNSCDLGNISGLSMDDLFDFDVGQGRSIPTLQVVLSRIGLLNNVRRAKGLDNIVFNIELKGPGTAKTVNAVVQSEVRKGLINNRDIFYCSSSNSELTELTKINPSAHKAIAINTKEFFGIANVMKDYMVHEDLVYQSGFFIALDDTRFLTQFEAIDCTFWDINDDLVDYAKKNRLCIHTIITGNLGINHVIIDRLLDLHERLGYDREGRSRLFFKTDCPELVKTIMEERLAMRSVLKDLRSINSEQQSDSPSLVPQGCLLKVSTEQMFNGEAVQWHMGAKGRFLRPGQVPNSVGQPEQVFNSQDMDNSADKGVKRARMAPPGYVTPKDANLDPLLFTSVTNSKSYHRVPSSVPPASYCAIPVFDRSCSSSGLNEPTLFFDARSRASANSAPPSSYCSMLNLNIDTSSANSVEVSDVGVGHFSPSFSPNETLSRFEESPAVGLSSSLASSFALPKSPPSPNHKTIHALNKALRERFAQNASGEGAPVSPSNCKKARLTAFSDSEDGLESSSTSGPTSHALSTFVCHKEQDTAPDSKDLELTPERAVFGTQPRLGGDASLGARMLPYAKPMPGSPILSGEVNHHVWQVDIPDKEMLKMDRSNSQSRQFTSPDNVCLAGGVSRLNSITPLQRDLSKKDFSSGDEQVSDEYVGADFTKSYSDNSQITVVSPYLHKGFDLVPPDAPHSPVFAQYTLQNSTGNNIAIPPTSNMLAHGSNAVMLVPVKAEAATFDASMFNKSSKIMTQNYDTSISK